MTQPSLSHAQARRYLELAADGDLDAARRAALKQHLAECPQCRAYADELNRLHVALKVVGERFRRRVRHTPDLSARVLKRLERANVQSFWLRLAGGLAQAGSLALMAVLMFGLWRPATTQAPAAPEATQPPAAVVVRAVPTPGDSQRLPAFELENDNTPAVISSVTVETPVILSRSKMY
jgi:anti-sigma factor RsiW